MSIEECAPIDTLSELQGLVRQPPRWADFTISICRRSPSLPNERLFFEGHACHVPPSPPSPPRPPPPITAPTPPKTLICHDMKNGYHDDRFIDGSDDHSAYLFYHWAAIDIFIYFSHHFITIPPLCWINVAHKHGVQILGTIITEWNDGFKICEEFLATEEKMETFISQLVSVAKCFKLDGWFLNVENKVDRVQDLLHFVERLTNEMHRKVPGSIVIWYDSVTITGSLSWQNCLNNNNKDFFDVCDGIFTNYCWNLTHLENSLVVAGDRKNDVFFGVDVWGRNFWGGGCFNTAEAVKEIHKNGLSIALFAPAWTHEGIDFGDIFKYARNSELCIDEKHRNSFDWKCATRSYFILRESAFWSTLWPYLNTRGPTDLPFHTFFCLGAGEKKRLNGKIISDRPWFNPREQQYQLSIPHCSINFILEEEVTKVENSKQIDTTDTDKTVDTNNDDRVKRDATADLEQNCTCQVAQLETASLQKKVGNNKPIVKKFHVKPDNEQQGCFEYYTNDSFYGGNCIKISPLKLKKQHQNDVRHRKLVRLFVCEFECRHNFIVYYIIKHCDKSKQDLNLLISMKGKHINKSFDLVLCGEDFPNMKDNKDSTILYPINFNNAEFKNLKTNLTTYFPSFYISDNDSGWEIRYYNLEFRDSLITNINCELVKGEGEILMGGLGIINDIPLF